MPLRVLVVPDKWKGSLSARAAARAIARGWARVRPQDVLDVLPMTDGGDGFGAVVSRLLHARAQRVRTLDAAHRPCRVPWWWAPASRTAVVESAAVIGLVRAPQRRRHPFELDTFGLGAVLRAAQARGARRCLVGLGGSATNDGGFGLARALGYAFLRQDGSAIERWTELGSLAQVRAPEVPLRLRALVAVVDVRNPLLGARGATRVYGPQKGLRASDFAPAERCLARLARVVAAPGSRALTGAGAGAAGGLGFGLQAFAGARVEPGFELFARLSRLARRLHAADVVIVAEGRIDATTFMGKGVGQVAALCRARGTPCIGLAGEVVAGRGSQGLTRAHALTELAPLAACRARPARWLERLSARVAGALAVRPL